MPSVLPRLSPLELLWAYFKLSRAPETLPDVANTSNSLNFVPAAGPQLHKYLYQETSIAHTSRLSRSGSFERNEAATQRNLGYGASTLQELRPQSSVSQAQAAMFDQLKAVGSHHSPPSQSLSPYNVTSDSNDNIDINDHSRLNSMDTPNYIVKGAVANAPESIPSIVAPWMFPSLATLGKVAVSEKTDGNWLFRALAGQICRESNQAGEVRRAIVNFTADNRDVYRALLPLSDIHNGQSKELPLNCDESAQFEEYLASARSKWNLGRRVGKPCRRAIFRNKHHCSSR